MKQIFDESFTGWMARCTSRPIGFSELPSDNPNIPYAVIYSISSPRGEGSWANPEEERDYVYQFTCVGKSPAQSGWMSDRVNLVLLGMHPNGRYLYDSTTIQGGQVLWRQSDALGGIVKTGDRLFQVIDTYRIRVMQ